MSQRRTLFSTKILDSGSKEGGLSSHSVALGKVIFLSEPQLSRYNKYSQVFDISYLSALSMENH